MGNIRPRDEAAIEAKLAKPHRDASSISDMQLVSESADTDARATLTTVMIWAAVIAAWVIGFVSNYLVAPTNTGLDVASSYGAFQPGSNVGNLVALLAWTTVSVWAGWRFARAYGPGGPRLLAGFGVTAAFSLYPSMVVGNAVGHVVPIEDGFVFNDWLAAPLVVAGVVSLVAAGVLALVFRVFRRQPAAA